jgi:hypothetical protein
MLRLRSALLALALLAAPAVAPAAAQRQHGGTPPSSRVRLARPAPSVTLPEVAVAVLRAEDEARARAQGGKGPLRFAEVIPVELDLANAGAWEELGGGARVWRLRLHSRGAKSLALVFARYALPAGAELYAYDDRRANVRGAFTEHENRLDGRFALAPLRGESLTLEYYEPARARGRGALALAAVTHDYLDVLGLAEDRAGGGTAQACEVDVACPLGAAWASQIDAAVRVMALPTGLLCSGSLLNNTAGDGTLLVLTAAHCTGLDDAAFLFNFERPSCGTGTAPMTDVLTGSTRLVADAALDVQLVRVLAPPGPLAFPAYLAGWDRSGVPPSSSVLIHHPAGDVKKISFDDDPPGLTGNFWRIDDWEQGVSEGGSSGAPLFDPAGRFIGNLDSGSSRCSQRTNDDFCTRLSVVWALLEPYLDPRATGQVTLDGLDLAAAPGAQPFDVVGLVPAVVATLDPGPARSVRILGTGFTDAATVALDGSALAPERYLRGGHTWMALDLPALDQGPHRFTLSDGAASEDLDFVVAAPLAPRFEADEGAPDDLLFSSIGIDTLYADQPGHVHACYVSLSNVPSVHPLLTLGLGNQFTQLRRCFAVTIPPAGWTSRHHNVPPTLAATGTKIYSQSVCTSHGLPLRVGDLQASEFQF